MRADWYYIAFPNDRWLPKTLVYSVYILDTVQTILVTNDVFTAYARHFGDIDQVNAVKLEWLAVPVFTSISGFYFSLSCIGEEDEGLIYGVFS